MVFEREINHDAGEDRPKNSTTQEATWDGVATFLHLVGRLKQTKRTGWLDRGVSHEDAESVADHVFRVALMAWLVGAAMDTETGEGPSASPDLDLGRVLLIALAHDLAEAVTGDLTPYDRDHLADLPDQSDRAAFLNQRLAWSPERKAAKHAAEAAALDDLLATLPLTVAETLRTAWYEYESGSTAEAQFVRQTDKLETFLQSREYLAEDLTRPMDSFAAEMADPSVLQDERLRALREAMTRVVGE